MSELTAPGEDRSSVAKNTAYTPIGPFLVNATVSVLLQDASNAAVTFAGFLVAGVTSIAVVFLLVQSLVEEWFAVAELTDE